MKGHPRALLGLLKVIGRARKATHWAREWAIQRHDLDVDEIGVATLLYDFAEILMWCFAPGLALQVADRQKADRTLRSVFVQTEVFGVPLYQIKQALAETWHLPQLLVTLMDPPERRAAACQECQTRCRSGAPLGQRLGRCRPARRLPGHRGFAAYQP